MRKIIRPVFWSCFLIALGGVLIANAVFATDIPVVRLFLGILVIGWGVSVILGGFQSREKVAARIQEKMGEKAERFGEKMKRAGERIERKLGPKARRRS
jgi:hypothetical protein